VALAPPSILMFPKFFLFEKCLAQNENLQLAENPIIWENLEAELKF